MYRKLGQNPISPENFELTLIAITFLVMNLSTHLSRVFYAFLCLFFKNRLFLEIDIIEHYDFASHRQQKLIFNQA
jgi:hypothetical protein